MPHTPRTLVFLLALCLFAALGACSAANFDIAESPLAEAGDTGAGGLEDGGSDADEADAALLDVEDTLASDGAGAGDGSSAGDAVAEVTVDVGSKDTSGAADSAPVDSKSVDTGATDMGPGDTGATDTGTACSTDYLHYTGTGKTFCDLSHPIGDYGLDLATEACRAHDSALGACHQTGCSAGEGLAYVVCNDAGKAPCACWSYAGGAMGRVSIPGGACACPTSVSPTWK